MKRIPILRINQIHNEFFIEKLLQTIIELIFRD